MAYVDPDIVDDETAVAESQLTAIADRLPGWEPSEGHVETALSESTAISIAAAAAMLKAEVAAAYRGFGLRILALPIQSGTPATAISTWVFPASAGATFSAGTEVELTLPDGSTGTYVTLTDIVVAASGSPTSVPGVEVVAVEAGIATNGATNPAVPSVPGVTSVTVTTAASGGSDAETDEEYQDRVADAATRLHVIPVTPEDYEAFALNQAGVERCKAVNRTDPGSPGDQPGHITLYPVHADGSDLSSLERTALANTFLATEKVVGATVHVAPVPRVNVTVAITVEATADAPGSLATDVQAAITAALAPSAFAFDALEAGKFARIAPTSLTIFQVSAAVDDLPGVNRVTAVTVNGGSAAVSLPAPLSLPNLTAPASVTVV